MTDPEPYDLTTADAAALVGCHSETIKRWALQGKVPSFLTPGGHRRFRRSDVDALLAGTATGPVSGGAARSPTATRSACPPNFVPEAS